MGLHRAGFRVIGIDKDPQPRYPFEFHQGDALRWIRPIAKIMGAVYIHASPPCQRDSVMSKAHNGRPMDHPDLIGPTQEVLEHLGIPYSLENVTGARAKLRDPIKLCGTMFPGLRVSRHRYFECVGFDIESPGKCPKKHPLHYTLDKRKPHYGKLDEMIAFVQVTGGGNCSVKAASDAMGIDWMTKDGLNEAIPPAYMEYIGKRAMAAIS